MVRGGDALKDRGAAGDCLVSGVECGVMVGVDSLPCPALLFSGLPPGSSIFLVGLGFFLAQMPSFMILMSLLFVCMRAYVRFISSS